MHLDKQAPNPEVKGQEAFVPMPFKLLSDLDLASYLASKVCHDVISPVGAIMNGLEVLEDKDSTDMHAFAIDLIQKSAKQASIKLQFARLTYGASGAAGSELDLGDAKDLAAQYFASDKLVFHWDGPKLLWSKPRVKLLLNMLIIAQGAIPRGGEMSVKITGTAPDLSFTITCTGKNARLPQPGSDFLNNLHSGENVDAHTIQPYFTKRLAEESKMKTTADLREEAVIFAAYPQEK